MTSNAGRDAGRLQADLDFQTAILPGVSRTFALTIPVLPEDLTEIVANAYLLCRVADTIEDDSGLHSDRKTEFHARLVEILRGGADPRSFGEELAPLLAPDTLDAERELVANTARIIRVTRSFSLEARCAIVRCLEQMCAGMPAYQRNKSLGGLDDLAQMSGYCYVVAGVVGEMLTELFCERRAALSAKRAQLMRLAPSFGQGLQMTNILKDIWEDRRGKTCWLPRSVFGADFDLSRLDELQATAAYRRGLEELIGIAHYHLRNALEYALHIPARETGMRRFCLWAIGLAVLTLRKIREQGGMRSDERVKISRRSVKTTVAVVNAACSSDRALRALFAMAAAGLPLAREEALLGIVAPGGGQPDASRA